MNPHPPPVACPDEAARLLPWFVNGTLPAADARFVEDHLTGCEACRADAAALAQVRALLRSPGQVEHAPHGGLRKLLQRIDAAEALPLPPPADRPEDPARPVAARPSPAAATRAGANRAVPWLAAAVVLQSLALLLVAVGAWRDTDPLEGAGYRTLTTAALPAGRPAVRVVFAPATTLAEVQQLLRSTGLVALAGPSEAGLFTLALREPAAGTDATLARLRADPRVHFAEALPPSDARP